MDECLEDENVTISRAKYREIQQKLQVIDQSRPQEKDNLIAQLTQKNKTLQENLFKTCKLLQEMRYIQGYGKKQFSPSLISDSGFGVSQAPVVENSDIAPASFISSVVTDGEVQQIGAVHQKGEQVLAHGKHFPTISPSEEFMKGQSNNEISGQNGTDATGNISDVRENDCKDNMTNSGSMTYGRSRVSHSGSSMTHGEPSMSQGGSYLQQVGYRKLQSLADLWCMSASVSQTCFKDAVKELRKTKSSLKEALSSANTNALEVMKEANYIEIIKSLEEMLENKTKEIERLYEERGLLHKQIEEHQQFKRSLREETEGISVPPRAMSLEQVKYSNHDIHQSEDSKQTTSGSDSSTVVNISDSQLQELQEKKLNEKKLQNELKNMTAKFDKLQTERNTIKTNYESLLRKSQKIPQNSQDCRVHEDSEETKLLKKELTNLRDTNSELLRNIEVITNQVSDERKRIVTLEAQIAQDKQKDLYSMHQLRSQLSELKKQNDKLKAENDSLLTDNCILNEKIMENIPLDKNVAVPCGTLGDDDRSTYGRNAPKFECEHCLMSVFRSEEDYLKHVQKCLP